jgi:hypothetical protein
MVGFGGLRGRFVAAARDFATAGLAAARDAGFRGFFDIDYVPDGAAISGLRGGRKRGK